MFLSSCRASPSIILYIVSLYVYGTLGISNSSTPPSNLPPAVPSIFTVEANILIDAPIDVVWNVLLGFPNYPDWNPFVRSQVVTDSLYIPTQDQKAAENLRLIITSQIPPLTPPVTASSLGDPLNEHITRENITHLQPGIYRVAWQDLSLDALIQAERWSALSVFVDQGGDSLTFYESREEYNGVLAGTVQDLEGAGLLEGFQAQASALKARAEA
ncbi:hypothetical protein J3R30DRAFT_3295417 [Lentinula aciculospora]|uniref:Coenzyme Q-binding protein COQ10 START domain-containing protein n=1 Tax=Lentinula aciculospora TaxID=153920 RepID=A0A9W9DLE9_9AGAR|nr:hypothetical protein J3R30DRAFT_3295417 [Lentinula aciculospora]